MKHATIVVVALVVIATLGFSSDARADGSVRGGNKHEETIHYWTPDRVAHAKPRDLFVGEDGKIAPPQDGTPETAKRDGASVPTGPQQDGTPETAKPDGASAPTAPRKGGTPETAKPDGTSAPTATQKGGSTPAAARPTGSSTPTVSGTPWPGGKTSGGLIQKTEGKVLFTMAGVNYVCSGTVVQDGNRLGSSLVLTAGHCVFDKKDGWATNWIFMPAFEDAPSVYNGTFNCAILTYGCWTATSLVTSAGWAAGDLNEDYAFAVVGPGGKNGTTQLDSAVGAQAITFSTTRPASVYAFGYPHASPYNGSDLIYCAGNTVADTWGRSTDGGLLCNMTGGSSGGGWLAPFATSNGIGTLVSLNSFKYTSGPLRNYMFGPRFDADTQRTYNVALTATAAKSIVP